MLLKLRTLILGLFSRLICFTVRRGISASELLVQDNLLEARDVSNQKDDKYLWMWRRAVWYAGATWCLHYLLFATRWHNPEYNNILSRTEGSVTYKEIWVGFWLDTGLLDARRLQDLITIYSVEI
jgi:hypothetical protein